MSLAAERNSDYINKVFMQVWTLRKLETFDAFLIFALFHQDSLTFLV